MNAAQVSLPPPICSLPAFLTKDGRDRIEERIFVPVIVKSDYPNYAHPRIYYVLLDKFQQGSTHHSINVNAYRFRDEYFGKKVSPRVDLSHHRVVSFSDLLPVNPEKVDDARLEAIVDSALELDEPKELTKEIEAIGAEIECLAEKRREFWLKHKQFIRDKIAEGVA